VGLVGRVPEAVALDRLRAAAAVGEGGAVLIVGEAGIGKTTLVEEAVARAAAAGATVRVARAVPDEGAPAYWPWLRLLEDVPGLSPQLLTATAAEGESQAAVLFRVAQRTVCALREAGHLVLVLEDLHWADAASIALLRMLCRESPGSRLLVVGTVRPPVLRTVASDPDQVDGLLADALATAGAAPADIARHRVRAAVDARSRQSAVDACRTAATAATRALDYAETIRWQGHAVELADDPADRLARATAAYAEGRLDLALTDCAAVLDSAERDHRADLAVRRRWWSAVSPASSGRPCCCSANARSPSPAGTRGCSPSTPTPPTPASG
jgi:RecA/RadA recombinase